MLVTKSRIMTQGLSAMVHSVRVYEQQGCIRYIDWPKHRHRHTHETLALHMEREEGGKRRAPSHPIPWKWNTEIPPRQFSTATPPPLVFSQVLQLL